MAQQATIIIVRNEHFAIVLKDVLAENAAYFKERFRVFTEWDRCRPRAAKNVLVISILNDLMTDARELEQAKGCRGRQTRFLLFKNESPVESVVEGLMRLGVQSPRRVHVARLQDDTPYDFFHRLAYATTSANHEQRILDAWWDHDSFVIISPDFERLRVRREELPAGLRDASPDELLEFEIDEEGEYVYWPSVDVHMGWSQFAQAADPVARMRAQRRSTEFNRRYGAAVRSLREARDLSQAQIVGLSARTLQRIETGRTGITVNALQKLAAAHGMDVREYTKALTEGLAKHTTTSRAAGTARRRAGFALSSAGK